MWIRRVMYPGTKFEIIEHGGESYFAAVRRRDAILVNPAGVVPVAKQRFGTKQVTLLGTRGAQSG